MHVKHAKSESKCWRYKNCIISSFVRIKIMFIFCWNSVPFLTRKKICFPQNFLSFPSPYPLFLFCLFLFVFSVTHQNTGKLTNMNLLRLLLIKLYYTDLSFSYIYTHHTICSFYYSWVRYNVYAPFTKFWFQKVVWDIKNFRIFRNFNQLLNIVLKEEQNEMLEALPIRFSFLIILYCYWHISYDDYPILIILYSQYYLFIIHLFIF